MKYRFEIPSLGITEKQLAAMPFGRQIEHLRSIRAWIQTAKSVHISQKRRTTAAALKEFKELYQPTEWYFTDTGSGYRNDSIEIFYKTGDQK